MLSIGATVSVYAGIGLLGGLVIKRPTYGVSYGITSALMTVALGILFGPKGYYASIGIQALALTLKIKQFAQVDSQINRVNT